MKPANGPIRWSVWRAAAEFNVDQKTLNKRLAQADAEPGSDKRYSTSQICAAIYGDIAGAKLRNQLLDADLKEIEKHKELREWVPVDFVERVWASVLADLRQKISILDIHDDRKQEILADLQNIPADDYFTTTSPSPEEDAEAGAQTA